MHTEQSIFLDALDILAEKSRPLDKIWIVKSGIIITTIRLSHGEGNLKAVVIQIYQLCAAAFVLAHEARNIRPVSC